MRKIIQIMCGILFGTTSAMAATENSTVVLNVHNTPVAPGQTLSVSLGKLQPRTSYTLNCKLKNDNHVKVIMAFQISAMGSYDYFGITGAYLNGISLNIYNQGGPLLANNNDNQYEVTGLNYNGSTAPNGTYLRFINTDNSHTVQVGSCVATLS